MEKAKEEIKPNGEKESKARPKQYRQGNLKILEWKNTSKDGEEYFTYNVEKFYKDKNDEWKTTTSFNFNELLKIVELIQGFRQIKNPVVETD